MASIKALRDSNNETIYPQTLTNAIFDLNNQSLDNLLALKMDASKVYTKEEMNNIISTLSSLKFEVLQKNEDETIPDLPAVGNTDTIYLRPKENDDTNNYYDEYIYLENGTYEKIGDTKVDLSNYYTKTEAGQQFAKLSKYSDTTINIGRKENTIIGENSIAEGILNEASGNYSHAEGMSTKAAGLYSHAEGYGTIASSECQHVEGRLNIEDIDKKYLHIIGNGALLSNGWTSPSNAHTLDWSGNAWFEGDVYVGSTSGTNKDEGSKKLATEEYIVNNAMPKSDVVTAFWTGTQAEYDALATKESTKLYLIKG